MTAPNPQQDLPPFKVGDHVQVVLPHDEWSAIVQSVNGDVLDLLDTAGNIEPVRAEYCTLAYDLPPFESGDRVQATLPDDVAGWYHPAGATWAATVVYVQGEQLDLQDDDGTLEPMPAEYCTLAPVALHVQWLAWALADEDNLQRMAAVLGLPVEFLRMPPRRGPTAPDK